jgi:DNA-directed RNA polymerase specialized sigma24 family protein
MEVITIPFNYTELNDPNIVPICIADPDDLGNPVHREWIHEGVVPVAGELLRIAQRILANKLRASEIAEYAVHSLSRTHGTQLGDRPEVKVLNRARRYAEDLRVGGRRARRHLDVELFSQTVESLEERYDFAAALEAADTLDKIMAEVDRLGLDRVKEVIPFVLRDAPGEELSKVFGQKRNTITKRLYRAMRKAAESAGITRY